MKDDKKKKEAKEEKDNHEECQKRTEELENQVKRTLADYQNLEKRTLDDRKNWIALANKELLLRLLPVLDTLIMAQKHNNDQSLKVSIKQFEDVLKSEGVVKIEAVGCDFDASLMEAIEVVEGEDGKVVGEVQSGYKIGEKLLRPAMVKVGGKK
ncbi:nucleotide exchange factor GrpE [Patescibacteria group bacterium]|nr:nucleotide exchange factor GrpE [Patescibacteria group bacterium]MCL5970443.1 nucleotide exchange factor GrpE [Patescibacteria group bacterium]